MRLYIKLHDFKSCDLNNIKKIITFQDYIVKITKIVKIKFEKTKNA